MNPPGLSNKLVRILQFHEDPVALAWWRARAGRALRWLTPVRRRWLLALAAVFELLDDHHEDVTEVRAWMGNNPGPVGSALIVVLLVGFAFLTWRLARRIKEWPGFARRHPQVCLHAVFWALVVLACVAAPKMGPVSAALACLVLSFPFLIWRLGYMLMSAQRGRLSGTFLRDHAFYLWPAYGGSRTPYGKGPDYLASCEARDEESLARSQMAGVRLLILALAWSICEAAVDGLVLDERNELAGIFGGRSLGLPHLPDILDGASASIGATWSVLYVELVHDVLRLAAKGHLVIGILRLFGFNVFRNTYKPLLAETVVEFWNRYFYYFKELLAQFFFFPTYARWFKTRPTLRMLTAVFAAAFVGNMYYHVIDKERMLVAMDWHGLWVHFGPRLVYCFLLALGIFVSMQREQRRAGKTRARTWWRVAASIFGVWTFFAIISIWNAHAQATIGERVHFLAHLIGIS